MVNSGCRDGLTVIWKIDPTGNRNVVAGTLHSHASNLLCRPAVGGNLHTRTGSTNEFAKVKQMRPEMLRQTQPVTSDSFFALVRQFNQENQV
jgi:hypothetical protein